MEICEGIAKDAETYLYMYMVFAQVTRMDGMFSDSGVFNQDINQWDSSKVTTFSNMFYGTNFNRKLSDWNTGHGNDFTDMFMHTSFQMDFTASWHTGGVTDSNRKLLGQPCPEDYASDLYHQGWGTLTTRCTSCCNR